MLKQTLLAIMIIFPSFLFGSEIPVTHSFTESSIRDYLPICSNNITPDMIYARISEKDEEIAYSFMFYWEEQEGNYKFAEHEHDWEFIVVYVDTYGIPEQVNYDGWHYYIYRTKDPDAYNDTNVLMFVDEDFHYFKPDRVIRKGNVTRQINNQTIKELTDNVLLVAKEQVGFDKELFDDPFEWKEMGWLGRYTAFDSNWKAFWVITDKKFEFIDLSDDDKLITKWL